MPIDVWISFACSGVCFILACWLLYKTIKLRRKLKRDIKEVRAEKAKKNFDYKVRKAAQRQKWAEVITRMSSEEEDELIETLHKYSCNSMTHLQSSYDVLFEDSYALYQELAVLHRKYHD